MDDSNIALEEEKMRHKYKDTKDDLEIWACIAGHLNTSYHRTDSVLSEKLLTIAEIAFRVKCSCTFNGL
jgi:hypothetical protein